VVGDAVPASQPPVGLGLSAHLISAGEVLPLLHYGRLSERGLSSLSLAAPPVAREGRPFEVQCFTIFRLDGTGVLTEGTTALAIRCTGLAALRIANPSPAHRSMGASLS